MTHEEDMKLRHYQPAGGSTWCGANARVLEREEEGTATKFSILKVPKTTDIRKVVCPECRKLIRITVHNYRD